MNKAVYDTRFFMELFYTKDERLRKRIEEQKKCSERYVSSISIYELYKYTLAHEGRETAKLRTTVVRKSFQNVSFDEEIAQLSAELSHKYRLSMGDSIIAATACKLDAICVSDDPHFQKIKEIKTAWI